MTPWVKRLIIANVAMFVIASFSRELYQALWLVPALIPVRPWTLGTYMFLHAGLWHLAFNMIGLFFFGPRLEARLGSRHFLGLYLVSGLVAGLASLMTPFAFIVGASGAVFGVLLAFAQYWPRERILLFFVLPIEARWLVIGVTVVSLYFGITGTGGNLAHFAHLGGFLGGWTYIKLMDRYSAAARFRRKTGPSRIGQLRALDVDRWRNINRADLHPINRDELDRILDKISRQGVTSLTAHEREFLERFS
jgi:membrane associated rhomboid family serine protease